MGNREQLGHGLSSMDARWTTGRVILNRAGTVAAGYEKSKSGKFIIVSQVQGNYLLPSIDYGG